MKIFANSQPHEIEAPLALDEFLRSLELEPRNVVVERNGEALNPSEARTCQLQDGDRLEIVRIVAGG